MDKQAILNRVDHTLLTTTATWEQVKSLCDEGLKYHTASVCIPPRFVKRAGDYVGNDLKICTVIGFPNGYNSTETKVFETEDAIRSGADEIDMVIPLGLVKAGDWDGVLTEIRAVKESCQGRILKVIVEAIEKAGFEPGKDFMIAMDPAVSEWYKEEDGGYYLLPKAGKKMTRQQMVRMWKNFVEKYPIISIEDGMGEEDWAGWKMLTQALGDKSQVGLMEE